MPLASQNGMNSILTFLTLLTATTTFEGKGLAEFAKSGSMRECSSINLQFNWSSNHFALKGGGYSCEDLTASFDPFVLEFRGNAIISEGKVVGTRGDRFIHIQYENSEEGFTYDWRLEKLPNGYLKYSEKWLEGNALSLTVSGILQPTP